MGKRRKGGSKQAEGENDAEYSKRQKKEGEGEYSPPYELQSRVRGLRVLLQKESGIVPADQWEAFIAALRSPLGVSFRITDRYRSRSRSRSRSRCRSVDDVALWLGEGSHRVIGACDDVALLLVGGRSRAS